ncbi:MAG: NAD(P)-dependent oxidoreductase [Candidatus Pacebacteria bacterium]|jgi:nucleoside-diphosphate-sugar epimerase|nr:NAD(P)-dependent oxidoreductase [Candidatus Paceibacterota bacterium]MBP9700853.1 NAD(P)-dependent oxidoreductase [Candidatus Paceibacterota bacterium]
MKKIALTGATGFVGNFVANYLESQGYEVYRFGRKNREGVIQWDIRSGVYKNDIPFDAVVHCAANVSDWSSYQAAYNTNVIGTKNVLKSFSPSPLFIYISSASVYSPFCKDVVITEESCVGGAGLNYYARTKLLGEQEVINSNIRSKVILRPHIIYGPGDTTIGPRLKSAIRQNRFIIPGNGENHISFTHVENLAQAIWQSILRSKTGNSIYNITDKESPIFNDAIQSFKRLNDLSFKEVYVPKPISFAIGYVLQSIYLLFKIQKAPPLTPYIVQQMTSDHILDISKAISELGYSPNKKYSTDFYI